MVGNSRKNKTKSCLKFRKNISENGGGGFWRKVGKRVGKNVANGPWFKTATPQDFFMQKQFLFF